MLKIKIWRHVMYSKTCCYPYFLQAKWLYDQPYWNAEFVDFSSYSGGPTFLLKWTCYSILKKKSKFVLDINVIFSNFWYQNESWFVIDFFRTIESNNENLLWKLGRYFSLCYVCKRVTSNLMQVFETENSWEMNSFSSFSHEKGCTSLFRSPVEEKCL